MKLFNLLNALKVRFKTAWQTFVMRGTSGPEGGNLVLVPDGKDEKRWKPLPEVTPNVTRNRGRQYLSKSSNGQ